MVKSETFDNEKETVIFLTSSCSLTFEFEKSATFGNLTLSLEQFV